MGNRYAPLLHPAYRTTPTSHELGNLTHSRIKVARPLKTDHQVLVVTIPESFYVFPCSYAPIHNYNAYSTENFHPLSVQFPMESMKNRGIYTRKPRAN